MSKRIILTLILLVIAGTGLIVGYWTWATRNAELDLDTASITDDNFSGQNGDEIPFGNPPANLMFSSDSNGDWNVMLLNSEGDLLNLSADDTNAQDIFASFSINGDQINFVGNRANTDALGPSQVNPDGTDLRTLPIISAVITLVQEGKFDWDPSWSPDGQTVAWTSLREANLEIYRIPVDQEIDIANATKLTSDVRTREWFASWSPDGTQIVYNSNEGGSENVWLMNAETGASTQLTDGGDSDLMHPMWSLDGDKLYYIAETDALYSEGELTIIEMNTDGTNTSDLTDLVQIDPVWSVGGTHIAFMSNVEGNWHIYVSRADGSNLRRVTDGDANHMFPVWMP